MRRRVREPQIWPAPMMPIFIWFLFSDWSHLVVGWVFRGNCRSLPGTDVWAALHQNAPAAARLHLITRQATLGLQNSFCDKPLMQRSEKMTREYSWLSGNAQPVVSQQLIEDIRRRYVQFRRILDEGHDLVRHCNDKLSQSSPDNFFSPHRFLLDAQSDWISLRFKISRHCHCSVRLCRETEQPMCQNRSMAGTSKNVRNRSVSDVAARFRTDCDDERVPAYRQVSKCRL